MSRSSHHGAPGDVPRLPVPLADRVVRTVVLDAIEVRRYHLAAGSLRAVPWDGEPLVNIVFVERGGLNIAALSHTDRRWRVREGQAFFVRSKGEYLFSRPDDTEVVMVSVPERIVHAFGARIDEAAGPVFAERSALIGPVAAYFGNLVGSEALPDRIAKYSMSRLAEEMVGSLFLERASLGVATGPTRVQAPLYHQALALIASRRSDPELTISVMATELAVSVRHLQRAFQERGTSPTEEIRRLRVELSQSLLTDAKYDVLSIEEIAQHSGFGSADDLRRAFRLQDVMPPSKLRAESRLARRTAREPISIADRAHRAEQPERRRA